MSNPIDDSKSKRIHLKTIFTFNEDQLVSYYEEVGLFFQGYCLNCQNVMSLWNDTSKPKANQKYHCNKCHNVIPKRYGIIFENMKISFLNFNYILIYYFKGFTQKEIYSLLEPLANKDISFKTVSKYIKLLRLMIHVEVQQGLSKLILPGPVEMDESCIYKIKRGKHGRLAKIIYWVFGLKCRTTGKVIVYPVLYRNRNTIMPIIQKHVAIGSVVYTDMFSVYFNNRKNPPESYLKKFGYIHFGINHSKEFVSKVDSTIHTNTIERTWKAFKRKFRNYKPRKEIEEYISEFIYESWIPKEDRYYFYLDLLKKYHHL